MVKLSWLTISLARTSAVMFSLCCVIWNVIEELSHFFVGRKIVADYSLTFIVIKKYHRFG